MCSLSIAGNRQRLNFKRTCHLDRSVASRSEDPAEWRDLLFPRLTAGLSTSQSQALPRSR